MVRELATAKAAIETGTSLEELGRCEENIRASIELAEDSLTDRQKKVDGIAIDAIHETREAWRITLDDCHRAIEQTSIAASAVILGEHSGNCSDVELEGAFAELGILSTFGKFYDPNFAYSLAPDYKGPPLRDYTTTLDNGRPRNQLTRSTLLAPLFKICLSRLNAAIHTGPQ